jgi:hypothetical protein
MSLDNKWITSSFSSQGRSRDTCTCTCITGSSCIHSYQCTWWPFPSFPFPFPFPLSVISSYPSSTCTCSYILYIWWLVRSVYQLRGSLGTTHTIDYANHTFFDNFWLSAQTVHPKDFVERDIVDNRFASYTVASGYSVLKRWSPVSTIATCTCCILASTTGIKIWSGLCLDRLITAGKLS